MSKSKPRKNSEDLENKNKKNGTSRNTNEIYDNSNLNFHRNDRHKREKTEEVKLDKKDN